jgi:hypothetical protein
MLGRTGERAVSKVFTSDIFDWARDLAIIQRIFGTGQSGSEGDLVELRTIRPAAGPARDEGADEEHLAEAEQPTQT